MFDLGLLAVETLGIVDFFGGTMDFLFILEGVTVLLLLATVIPVRLVVDCKREVGLRLGGGGVPLGDPGDVGEIVEETIDFLL